MYVLKYICTNIYINKINRGGLCHGSCVEII